MADIFVSYAREDEERIAALVQLLEAQGLSVFWDRHIPPGKSWRSHIGQALADARCVIVAWSRHSIASSFVTEEADDARSRGILVPVMIDAVTPPLGFRSVQAAEMADLGSEGMPARFGTLLAAVRAAIGGAAPPPVEPARTVRPASPPWAARNKVVGIAVAGAAGVLAVLLAWWQPFAGEEEAWPPQAVVARNTAAPARVAAGRDSVELVSALRPEAGGIEITVQVIHRGDAPLTVIGSEAFVLVRRDGSVEALLEQNSSPVFYTLQTDSTQKFSLRFDSADGIALRASLPSQAPQQIRLPASP